MKKYVRLLILAVVLIVLVAVFLVTGKKKKAALESRASASIPVFSGDYTAVNEVSIKTGDTTLTLTKSGDTWTSSRNDAVDQSKVKLMLQEMCSLLAMVQVENPGSAASYGLDPARVTVTFRMKDASSHTVKLGNITPVNSYYYMTFDGDLPVYCISDYTYKELSFTADSRTGTSD